MAKILLLVESSCVGAGHTARAAQQLGYEPVFLTDRAFSQGDTRAQLQAHRYVECPTHSVEEMARAAESAGAPAAVTSFSDTCLMNASRLGRKLGAKGGLDPAVERLKDKGEVYKLVPEFSPPSALFTAQDIPLDQLRAMLRAHGGLIVKGRRGSGGQGSVIVRQEDQLGKLGEQLANSPIPAHLSPDLYLAQAFVDGVLVSLEGFVQDGTPHFLGFSGRHKVGMSEARIMFPWDDHLSAAARESAYAALRALFTRAELRRGYFHVEFMTTPDRAYLIDANVGRIGGGGLGQQIAIAHGISPEEVHVHALALSVGDEAKIPAAYAKGPQRRTISIMYGMPEEAVFKGLTLPPDVPGYHTLIMDPEQKIPAMGGDNYAWISIASGEDGPLQQWVDRIVIHSSRGDFRPVY